MSWHLEVKDRDGWPTGAVQVWTERVQVWVRVVARAGEDETLAPRVYFETEVQGEDSLGESTWAPSGQSIEKATIEDVAGAFLLERFKEANQS